MAVYPMLASIMAGANIHSSHVFETRVIPYLLETWLDDYRRFVKGSEILETSVDGFSYLFDVTVERLVAAWGISHGRHAGARDRSRMAGHPLSAGPDYHRGHSIPHTLGGTTDINLVPQLGAVNIGPFRELEKRAVATPGSLYFTYWVYGASGSQRPLYVQQGILVPGSFPDIRTHPN